MDLSDHFSSQSLKTLVLNSRWSSPVIVSFSVWLKISLHVFEREKKHEFIPPQIIIMKLATGLLSERASKIQNPILICRAVRDEKAVYMERENERTFSL